MAVGRGRFDDAQVAGSGHGQVQGARDRGRAHGEDVDRLAHALEGLLVLHPEALLLVDHDQAQVLEHDVGLQEPVGADQDVDLAGGGRSQKLLLLLGAAEPAEHLDRDRVTGHPLAEGVQMLLGQDRGRDQHGHLPAVLRRLEGGPDRHLGLAEADVAADQPVHRARPLHVGLGLGDGPDLVGGGDEGEGGLEFLLPGRVGPEGVARLGLAARLDLEEFSREVEGRHLRSPPRLFPAAGADLAQLGLGLAQPHVAADQVGLGDRHVQRHSGVELK